MIRRPARIDGKAPGSTTAHTTRPHDRPKLCAMRINPRGTASTPAKVLMIVGKNTPNATVNSLLPSPMPNQMMNNGTRAILGTGNNAPTTAMPGPRTRANNPMASPASPPAIVPASHPSTSRLSDALRWAVNSPDTASVINVRPIAEGIDENAVPNQCSRAPASQDASSTASVTSPAIPPGRVRNPLPRNRTSATRQLLLGGRGIRPDQRP